MPFIITDPCIETKDTACVDVCPVDCIHPRKDEPEFAQTTMLYIHPDECIDCGACVPACPVAAIYESIDATPAHQKALIEANAIYRNAEPDTIEIVQARCHGRDAQKVQRAVLKSGLARSQYVRLPLDAREVDRPAGEPRPMEPCKGPTAGDQAADAGGIAEHLVERHADKVRLDGVKVEPIG